MSPGGKKRKQRQSNCSATKQFPSKRIPAIRISWHLLVTCLWICASQWTLRSVVLQPLCNAASTEQMLALHLNQEWFFLLGIEARQVQTYVTLGLSVCALLVQPGISTLSKQTAEEMLTCWQDFPAKSETQIKHFECLWRLEEDKITKQDHKTLQDHVWTL